MRKLIWTLALAGGMAAVSMAAPTVTFTTTGSAGNWTLDFNVTNSLGVNGLDIYFFGVQLGANDITASPANWIANYHPTWNPQFEGGSSTTYNNTWITYSNITTDTINQGQTLGGFEVHDTSLVAPTSVHWFAYAFALGNPYPGNDNFWLQTNPGFEGVATPSAVPEPASFSVLASICGLAALRRRLKR